MDAFYYKDLFYYMVIRMTVWKMLIAKDGEVYDFDGKKAIVIGGAYSRDKEYRILSGLPWFPDEQPDEVIKKQVKSKLAELRWRVDYVFSHTCPLLYRPRQTHLRGIDQSTEEWMKLQKN